MMINASITTLAMPRPIQTLLKTPVTTPQRNVWKLNVVPGSGPRGPLPCPAKSHSPPACRHRKLPPTMSPITFGKPCSELSTLLGLYICHIVEAFLLDVYDVAAE